MTKTERRMAAGTASVSTLLCNPLPVPSRLEHLRAPRCRRARRRRHQNTPSVRNVVGSLRLLLAQLAQRQVQVSGCTLRRLRLSGGPQKRSAALAGLPAPLHLHGQHSGPEASTVHPPLAAAVRAPAAATPVRLPRFRMLYGNVGLRYLHVRRKTATTIPSRMRPIIQIAEPARGLLHQRRVRLFPLARYRCRLLRRRHCRFRPLCNALRLRLPL